jgi:hypothetical protein
MQTPSRVLTEADAGRVVPLLEAGDRLVVRLPAKGSPWRVSLMSGPLNATTATPTTFGFQTRGAGRVRLTFVSTHGATAKFALEVR